MTAIMFAALIWQVVDWLSEVTNWSTHRASAAKQGLAWLAGIALVGLASHAAVTARLVLPGMDLPVGQLDGASIALVGLQVASLASTGRDLTNAIDNRNTAYVPPLGGPSTPVAG